MRIYIIDNSMMTWAWIVNAISQVKGLEITGFSGNTRKAIDTINKINPDLVFLNHQIYSKSDVNIIKKIKLMNHDTKIVVLGENTPINYKDDCLNAGADYYFDMINNHRKNTNALLQIVHDLKSKKTVEKDIYSKAGIFFKDIYTPAYKYNIGTNKSK